MDDCVFCKIRDKQIPTKLEYESDTVMAFPDIDPAAEVHILIVPKEHIPTFLDIKKDDKDLISEMVDVAQKMVVTKKLDRKYRISFNGGSLQVVPHLHWHLLGGEWIKNKHDF